MIHSPTSMFSCLLLEDDPKALELMKDILSRAYPSLKVHSCKNLSEADDSYALHRQKLLILDVNLPDGNSLHWLKKISEDAAASFSVIFITAFADYAVEAFKFSALDFLLKPYLPADLVKALNKAVQNFSNQRYHQQLEIFFHNYDHQAKEDKKIVLKTVEDIFVVPVDDILVAEADNSYTLFILKTGQRILVSQSLKEFDQQLSPLGFLRVHQSFLINLKYIKTFKKKSNLLLLEGELQVPVSQHKKIRLMDYLNSL
ncbi:LytTR family DNA-binding domain-containing protein [Pedobacter sp. L105]|uniref:LytR/AlgR family response regulator transcription factor n=1 Tax=Pedobacter sp. L105 TaxID=1641871 RepID=UPI00131B5DA6|nr:LytTR family DNA-binding domain-containing protein [Pedobacter sp. L105]